MQAINFLQAVENDDQLRAAVALTDGELERIVALAIEAGFNLSNAELEQACLQMFDDGGCSYAHPEVYFAADETAGRSDQSRTALSFAHPQVYFC